MVKWKYFATSHGKGVVDGIGGAAKSNVHRRVMSKGANARVVQRSCDFASVAQGSWKVVNVLHVSQDEISKMIQIENPWEMVKDAPGVSRIHKVDITYTSVIVVSANCFTQTQILRPSFHSSTR